MFWKFIKFIIILMIMFSLFYITKYAIVIIDSENIKEDIKIKRSKQVAIENSLEDLKVKSKKVENIDEEELKKKSKKVKNIRAEELQNLLKKSFYNSFFNRILEGLNAYEFTKDQDVIKWLSRCDVINDYEDFYSEFNGYSNNDNTLNINGVLNKRVKSKGYDFIWSILVNEGDGGWEFALDGHKLLAPLSSFNFNIKNSEQLNLERGFFLPYLFMIREEKCAYKLGVLYSYKDAKTKEDISLSIDILSSNNPFYLVKYPDINNNIFGMVAIEYNVNKELIIHGYARNNYKYVVNIKGTNISKYIKRYGSNKYFWKVNLGNQLDTTDSLKIRAIRYGKGGSAGYIQRFLIDAKDLINWINTKELIREDNRNFAASDLDFYKSISFKDLENISYILILDPSLKYKKENSYTKIPTYYDYYSPAQLKKYKAKKYNKYKEIKYNLINEYHEDNRLLD